MEDFNLSEEIKKAKKEYPLISIGDLIRLIKRKLKDRLTNT